MKVALVDQFGLKLSDIKSIQTVRTGFAIRANNNGSRTRLITPYSFLEKEGAKVEAAEEWHGYVVKNLPVNINTVGGLRPITDFLGEEIKAATRQDPVTFKQTRHGSPNASTRNWIVYLAEPVKRSFRLFESGPAEPIRKKTQITQCQKCYGYHDPRACNRATRCPRCGAQEQHEQCHNPPKCTNCGGPHEAQYLGCQARPRRKDGIVVRPTQRQLKAIRRLGQQEYEAAHNDTLSEESLPRAAREERLPEQGREELNGRTTPCPSEESEGEAMDATPTPGLPGTGAINLRQ
ncbi:putative reverse transcriptase [Macrophomina phaseolina MS6]|uniref:Putative reverse transcriptase n=1 Tax=Macrophomina phaseolina (strain MS6) TaxID=1126212 RepID=K2R8D0_MACPH|nr:putative reverse transcriptase [Macrophomina phaseolina MS6]